MSFVVLMAVAAVFSIAVGNNLAHRSDPREVGSSRIGEWADLSEQGFRVRVDSLTIAPRFPSAYDPESDMIAPPGMAYLRVRMTIEPLVGPDDNLGCRLTMLNGAGEQLTLTEFGIEGPLYEQCLNLSEDAVRERGVPYETQTVYVVIPEPVENFTLQLHPMFASEPIYWTFRA